MAGRLLKIGWEIKDEAVVVDDLVAKGPVWKRRLGSAGKSKSCLQEIKRE